MRSRIRRSLAAIAAGFGLLLPVAGLSQTVPITSLPAAGVLSGSEVVPGVQGGTTVQLSANQIVTLVDSVNNTYSGNSVFNGTVTMNGAVSAVASVVVGSPTGGACGAGCANFASLKVNGNPVTPGITSFTLSVPSYNTVTGSPCTSASCSIVIGGATEPPNCVLASPNIVSGAVTCRSVVPLDLPPINLASTANGGVAPSSVLPAMNGGTGESGVITGLVKANGTGAYTAATAADVTNPFGGNNTCWLRGDSTCQDSIANAIASAGGGSYAGSGISSVLAGSPGSGDGFRTYLGLNGWWNGSTWITGTDGASNGAGLILSSYGAGDLEFFTIPGTGGTSQSISNASLASNQRMVIGSGGNITLNAAPSGATLTNNGTTTLAGALTANGGIAASGTVSVPASATAGGSTIATLGASQAFTGNNTHSGSETFSGTTSVPASATAGGSTIATVGASQTFTGNNTHSGTENFTGPLQLSGVAIQQLPMLVNFQSSNYTLVASDCGKLIVLNGSSGQTLTVPQGVLSAGCVVGVQGFNGTNTYTVVQGSSMNMYWAGQGVTTGNRTLTSVAQATIVFNATNNAVISGSGVT